MSKDWIQLTFPGGLKFNASVNQIVCVGPASGDAGSGANGRIDFASGLHLGTQETPAQIMQQIQGDDSQ